MDLLGSSTGSKYRGNAAIHTSPPLLIAKKKKKKKCKKIMCSLKAGRDTLHFEGLLMSTDNPFTLYHSGPDIVIHWASGDVYYDFTIVHELSQSNVGRSTAQLFRDAIKRKVSKYVASKLIPNEQFQCVPMLSGGAMHSNTKALITTLADACGLERDFVVQDFTLRLQELNGSVVMSQLRKYIATTQVDNTAF